jgi:hypothetical protein
MKKQRKKRQRHAFLFKVKVAGKDKTFTHWARVFPAKRDIYLPLRADHVRRSIGLKGAGNTQTCSMSVCAQDNAEMFPHDVEGYIDWFYSRAFVVSRLDKNGIPCECYVYQHSDGIGRLNDTPGGQHKLLDELEAEGGERIIHLRPLRQFIHHKPGKPIGHRDGSRTKVQPRGAKLRFAVAELGGVPA